VLEVGRNEVQIAVAMQGGHALEEAGPGGLGARWRLPPVAECCACGSRCVSSQCHVRHCCRLTAAGPVCVPGVLLCRYAVAH
jgi:hypothetical protein